MSIDRWMDKEDEVHIYNGILFSDKKKQIWVTYSEVDEPRASCTEWSKSEREKQITYINIIPGIHKNDTYEPSREWTCGHSRGRWSWDKLRKQHWHIYTIVCKINSGKLLFNTVSTAWCWAGVRGGEGGSIGRG